MTSRLHICMVYFRPFTPKRFGKTRLFFINCQKACNCCTLMDIIAYFSLPKTSLLFQKSSNYLYYSNPYFPQINRNIQACLDLFGIIIAYKMPKNYCVLFITIFIIIHLHKSYFDHETAQN